MAGPALEELAMSRVCKDVQKIVDGTDRRLWRTGAGGYADEVELIRRRCNLLSKEDRALVLYYLDNGRRLSEAAGLLGVCEGTVARRVGRIIRRLLDGQYIACLRHRRLLGRLGMGVARDYLIDGLSMHAVAERRGVTVYQVRKMLHRIRGLGGCEGGSGR